MARIVLTDGTYRDVDYNTAAQVYRVHQGLQEPEDDRQAAFVKQVKEVLFDGVLAQSEPLIQEASFISLEVHDNEMDKILADPDLHGIDKAKAVIERIKQRRAVR